MNFHRTVAALIILPALTIVLSSCSRPGPGADDSVTATTGQAHEDELFNDIRIIEDGVFSQYLSGGIDPENAEKRFLEDLNKLDGRQFVSGEYFSATSSILWSFYEKAAFHYSDNWPDDLDSFDCDAAAYILGRMASLDAVPYLIVDTGRSRIFNSDIHPLDYPLEKAELFWDAYSFLSTVNDCFSPKDFRSFTSYSDNEFFILLHLLIRSIENTKGTARERNADTANELLALSRKYAGIKSFGGRKLSQNNSLVLFAYSELINDSLDRKDCDSASRILDEFKSIADSDYQIITNAYSEIWQPFLIIDPEKDAGIYEGYKQKDISRIAGLINSLDVCSLKLH